MALSARQEKLYTHRVNIWRFTETIDTATGKVTGRSWAAVAALVPCFVQVGVNFQGPEGPVLAESENMLTTDAIHFEASVDVRVGDVLKQVVGPDAGDYWTVRGNPRKHTRHANKLTVAATRSETPPQGVS